MSIKFKHQIKALTRGDNYSHAVLSFNIDLTDMYSFDDEGLVKDTIDNDSWMGTDSIYVCVMFIEKDEFDNMHKHCEEMYKDKNKTKYAYANLLRAYVGKPIKQDKRYVCSTFTSFILAHSNPKNLHRDFSRLRPEDITILPRAFFLINVKDRDEFRDKKSIIKSRLEKIKEDHLEELEDYNNLLPKIKLEDKMDQLKTFDKILDWLIEKL